MTAFEFWAPLWGAPFFCCKFVDRLVDDICKDLDTVGRMSSYQSQRTLVAKAVQHKINHLGGICLAGTLDPMVQLLQNMMKR